MLDLKKTNISEMSEKGYEFELLLPEVKEPTDGFVTVRGEHSSKVKEFASRKFTEIQRAETIAKRKNKELDPTTLEELRQMTLDAAVIRLVSWRNIAEDGKDIPFTEENVRRILKANDWITTAIIEASNNLSNFI